MARWIQYPPIAEPFVPAEAPVAPPVAGWMPQAPVPIRRASRLAAFALACAFVSVPAVAPALAEPVYPSQIQRTTRHPSRMPSFATDPTTPVVVVTGTAPRPSGDGVVRRPRLIQYQSMVGPLLDLAAVQPRAWAPSDSGLIGRLRLIQYQALVRPLLDIVAPPVEAPALTPPVYPAWIARLRTHAARMPAFFMDADFEPPTPPFDPGYFDRDVYPDWIDRKTFLTAKQQAFAMDARWDPPTPPFDPGYFDRAIFPDRIDRRTLKIGDYLFFVGDPSWLPPTPPQPGYYTETLVLRRLRRSPHISSEDVWVFYKTFQVDLETGIGLDVAACQEGYSPQVMLRWSDDDGETWSNEHWVSAGRIGEYDARADWRRLGRGRDRVFEVVVSDPVAWNIIAAYLNIQRGTS